MKNIVIDYLKDKSYFKFEEITDIELINFLDGIVSILVVKKNDNFIDKNNPKPIVSIILNNKESFIKYVNFTDFFELNKLNKYKFLKSYEAYCQKLGIKDTHYDKDMLISVINFQQQLQGYLLEKYEDEIKEIISLVLNTNDFEVKIDDSPLVVIETKDKVIDKQKISYLIKDNINQFMFDKVKDTIEELDDILQVNIEEIKK